MNIQTSKQGNTIALPNTNYANFFTMKDEAAQLLEENRLAKQMKYDASREYADIFREKFSDIILELDEQFQLPCYYYFRKYFADGELKHRLWEKYGGEDYKFTGLRLSEEMEREMNTMR